MSSPIGISVLASGSKGNAVFVEGPEGALLVDAGLSAREILRRLDLLGVDPGRLSGILVTHDHSDHLRGVRVLAKRLGLTVYGTEGTLSAAGLPESCSTRPFLSGGRFEVAGFEVQSFSLPHDAADPVGYVLTRGGARIGIATDLGYATALIRKRLAACGLLVLEFNHDERMLQEGPYPWFLKQRIRSRRGHLSNDAAAQALQELFHPGLQHLVLAHLSEVNNCPRLALGTARDVLGQANGTGVQAAGMAQPTPMIRLEE